MCQAGTVKIVHKLFAGAYILSDDTDNKLINMNFFFLRFYLFIHERHREKERQRHRGEAGSMQEA